MQSRALLVYAALALGIVLVYAPVRSFEFVSFDDPLYVTDNPPVEAGLTRVGVSWALSARHAANWHPLTWLSHMLDVELFGLDAGAHHVTNVVLHVVNSCLLFALLQAMTGRTWASAFVAMVFAFHPLRVESVAWVSERKDVLSTCFWMLVLAAYVHWVRRRGTARYALVLVLFALGLTAKPMLVTLPCVLLLLDYWPLRRLEPAPTLRQARALVIEKLPLFALAGLAALVTLQVQESGGAVVALDKIPVPARLANAAVSYVRYVGAVLYPSGLAIFYPYRPWPAWVAGAAAGALLAATVLALRAARRRPYILVGWLWYVVTLLPVIGLVQVGSQSMADRYTYVPHVGLTLIVAWSAAEALGGGRRGRTVLAAAAAVVAAASIVLSARQVSHWRNTEALFAHALAVTRDNYLAHMSLGEALGRQGRFEESRRHHLEALRLNPASAAVHLNIGNVYLREDRIDDAEREFREALRLKADAAEAHNSLGLALGKRGRVDDAIEQYRQALAVKPHYPEAHVNLGNALNRLGRFDAAAEEFRAGIARRSDWADGHYGLAVAIGSLGDLAGAEREYAEAARLEPEFAEAHFGRGLVLAAVGRRTDAIGALREAVRLEPTWAVATEALAWVLATGPDATPEEAREAVAFAEAARKAAGQDDTRLLDTLGAAYAASGRFAEAAAVGRRAAALALATGDERFARDVESRIALYESGRAVRSGVREVPR